MDKKYIIAAVDFTETSKTVLEYAINMAAETGHQVFALHMLAEEDERFKMEEKLKGLVNALPKGKGIAVTTRVIEGDPAHDITKVAETLDADLVLLGLHPTGLYDDIFGSHAMKIVRNSEVPFLIINQYVKYKPVKRIGVTLDDDKENLQVVRGAAKLALAFNAEVQLIAAHDTNEARARDIEINMNIAEEYLNQLKLSHGSVLIKKDDYIFHLVEYCEDYNIDIIASTYRSDNLELFSEKFVQKLVEKSTGIPVLTMESAEIAVGSPFYFMQ